MRVAARCRVLMDRLVRSTSAPLADAGRVAVARPAAPGWTWHPRSGWIQGRRPIPTRPGVMRILVVGDPFLDTSMFERGLSFLGRDHSFEFLQVGDDAPFSARSASERRIREYAGTPRAIIERMEGIEVLVVHGAPVTDEVLDASSCLGLVCCARGGPANVDITAASDRGIPVAITPGKNAEAVAEQTIGFLIMLARRLPRAQRFLSAGGQLGGSTFEGAQFIGRELAGQTLGLVGFGYVGRAVWRRARALDMRVAIYDPFVCIAADGEIEQLSELAELLAVADFVSLHARATPENDTLFDGPRIAQMRSGAFLINTARETLVDEQALDDALTSGHLGGAALDVVRPSQQAGPHRLLRHDNVILTPHIGGATQETLLRGASMVGEEIVRFAAGERLRHVINKAAVGG
jgi:D-3-phosphoglycerate dehydrogenase